MSAVAPDHPLELVLVACRGFRLWAVENPREFELIFASTEDPARRNDDPATDRCAAVFFGVVGAAVGAGIGAWSDDDYPPALTQELEASRLELLAALATVGVEISKDQLSLTAVHKILQWWIRIYGQVAVEVFNGFPFDVNYTGKLFESMLDDLATDLALPR